MNLTHEDSEIADNLWSRETVGALRRVRTWSAQRDADVMAKCAEERSRSRNGDWQHNVDLSVHGLSPDDAEEVFYARHHHREVDLQY